MLADSEPTVARPGAVRDSQATRVLVESYACGPGMGSEPGAGWNLPWHLARAGCDVTVVASPLYRNAVDAELAAHPAHSLHVVYVSLRQWPLRLGWHPGSNIQYLLWLWDAASVARALHRRNAYDVCHHVSYGSISYGSFLWRLKIPLVLGPMGGGQVTPAAFKRYFTHGWRTEALRSFIVRRLSVFNPFARTTCAAASLAIVSNEETRLLAHRLGTREVEILAPDQGLASGFAPKECPAHQRSAGLRLLWVGGIYEIKALPLALDALAGVSDASVMLDIVGSGTYASHIPEWIEDRGLSARATHHGQVGWQDMRRFYRDADALIFTSLRDSCGGQLLEAMAWGLPIITLDHQGAAWAVPVEAGVKIPVSTPEATCAGLAEAIRLLARNPALREAMGAAGYAHAQGFTWDAIARRVMGHYERLVGGLGGDGDGDALSIESAEDGR